MKFTSFLDILAAGDKMMIITALRQRIMSSYVMIGWALIASKFISWQVKRVSSITEEYNGNIAFGISVSDGIYCHDLYEIGGRGSPSLVGRGIANPMSERTRGFEMPRRERNKARKSHSPRLHLSYYYNCNLFLLIRLHHLRRPS